MIYHTMAQGTEEWLEVRRSKMTGSQALVWLTKGKKELGIGLDAQNYIYRKAAEYITGEGQAFKGNAATERGNDYEPLAIKMYEEETYNTVKPVGFVQLSDFVGSSPDGLIDHDGIIEVKCPLGAEFMKVLDNNSKNARAHFAQIQFNLFVTNRQWCDYVTWHPKFGHKALIIKRIERDEKMIQVFKDKALIFENEMKRLLKDFD